MLTTAIIIWSLLISGYVARVIFEMAMNREKITTIYVFAVFITWVTTSIVLSAIPIGIVNLNLYLFGG